MRISKGYCRNDKPQNCYYFAKRSLKNKEKRTFMKVYDNTMCEKLDDRQSRRQKSSISSSNCLDEYAKFYSRKENVYELSLSLFLCILQVYIYIRFALKSNVSLKKITSRKSKMACVNVHFV